MEITILEPVEVKREILNILIRFDDVAKEQGLTYSLSYGTLLGAVRHKGFIPWDDDIDVVMPRPDYDRLIRLIESGLEVPGHRFVGYELGNYPMPYLKLQNTQIAVSENYCDESLEAYLWIDIFPIDGVPADDYEYRSFWRKARRKQLLGVMGHISAMSGSNIVKKAVKFGLRLYCKYMGGAKRATDELVAMCHEHAYADSEYVADVVAGDNPDARMAKNEFEKLISLEFEGHMFPAFQNYDKLLTHMYGDYMKLPPIEKRVSHGVVASRLGSGDVRMLKSPRVGPAR